MQAVLVGGSGGTAREAVRESSAQWHSQLVAAGIVGTKRQRLKDYADSFYGSDFITWLVRSGRCQSREEGLQFGEALRERDILHHVNDQHKFKDDKLIYRMRAVEGIEGDGSTLGPTVPQLLNQSRYMMGAWFLKQGAVFLNRRYFVLDKLSRRLYVFTNDVAPSPRYCIDFTAVVCVCEGLATPSLSPSLASAGPSGNDDLSVEISLPLSMHRKPSEFKRSVSRGSLGTRSSDEPPHDRSTTSTSPKHFGIHIKGPSVSVLAYAETQRQYETWLKALADAVQGKIPSSRMTPSTFRARGVDPAVARALTSPGKFDLYTSQLSSGSPPVAVAGRAQTPQLSPHMAASPLSTPAGRRSATPDASVRPTPAQPVQLPRNPAIASTPTSGSAISPPNSSGAPRPPVTAARSLDSPLRVVREGGVRSVATSHRSLDNAFLTDVIDEHGLPVFYVDVLHDYLAALGDWNRLYGLSASDLDDMGVFVPRHRKVLMALVPSGKELSSSSATPSAAASFRGSFCVDFSDFMTPVGSTRSASNGSGRDFSVRRSSSRGSSARDVRHRYKEPIASASPTSPSVVGRAVHPNAFEFSIPPRARFDIQQTHFKLQLAKAVSDYIAACDVGHAATTLPPHTSLSEDDAAEFASCSTAVRQPSVVRLCQLSKARGSDTCIALDSVCDWTRLYHDAGSPGSDGVATDALCAAWTSVLVEGCCVCVDSTDSAASGGWSGPGASNATPQNGTNHDVPSSDRIRKVVLCLFQDHLIRVLLWGDHPLSVLVQKLCASFQCLYGPLSVHRYCLSPQEALDLGKKDLQTALAHAQKMVTDLPFAWLDALNSFGTRLLAQSAVRSSRSPSIVSPLKPAVSTPSSAPHSSVSDAQSPVVEDVSTDPASLPLHRRWLLMSGSTAAVKDAASTPTRSSASSVSVDSPIAAVPRGGSSIFLSASLTSAALKTASTLTVSEEDLDRISQEALRRVVFHIVGDTVMQLYARAHAAEDDVLTRLHTGAWGITCQQVKLDPRVCVDAAPSHHLDVVLDKAPPQDKADLSALAPFWRPLQPAVDAFAAFSAAKSPEEKRDLLIVCVKSVFQCVRSLKAAKSSIGDKRVGLVNIDADSMVGMFCYLTVHACVPLLYAQSDFLGDFLNEVDAIQIAGFYLTSVQSALSYLVSVRPVVLPCGFCEARVPQVQCKTCVRRLCERCDEYIHGSSTPVSIVVDAVDACPDVVSTPITPDGSGHVRVRYAIERAATSPVPSEHAESPDGTG